MKTGFSKMVLILTLSWMYGGSSASECQPHTWSMSTALQVGEINCREDTISAAVVGPHTCKALAEKSDITLEEFLFLNPSLDDNCNNIEPDAEYCVVGFPEPLRAYDGICGPETNATCIGTGKQCCNAQTWTCGDMEEDCSAENCYEGACAIE